MLDRHAFILSIVVLLPPVSAAAGPLVIDARLHHLRVGTQREWADFPVKADGGATGHGSDSCGWGNAKDGTRPGRGKREAARVSRDGAVTWQRRP
jgi:hypothetical protein